MGRIMVGTMLIRKCDKCGTEIGGQPLDRESVTVSIGGVPATVTYAGAAPGFLQGLLQVNVQVPDDAPAGSADPLVMTVGGLESSSGVTMAVQ